MEQDNNIRLEPTEPENTAKNYDLGEDTRWECFLHVTHFPASPFQLYKTNKQPRSTVGNAGTAAALPRLFSGPRQHSTSGCDELLHHHRLPSRYFHTTRHCIVQPHLCWPEPGVGGGGRPRKRVLYWDHSHNLKKKKKKCSDEKLKY